MIFKKRTAETPPFTANDKAPVADAKYGFSAREWRMLRGLKTPAGIQRLLNALSYHDADTAWSPRRVLREGTAHCLEGGILAAAALRTIGHPPLILDLVGEQDDDHIIAVYRERGHWGAVSKSHFNGLRERPPIFRSLRELALSYFEDYYNGRGERTLRKFSEPVDLSRFDGRDWMTTERPIWFVPKHLVFRTKHIPLITAAQAKSLARVDRLAVQAGLIGYDHSLMFANGKSIVAELVHTDPRARTRRAR
ncbi:MAG TPA: hypothetical protein VEV38_05275 [Candidatus Eremiobacteraceae bacterium]|nr:hypothetical protein [Candidatus Eremiobacteraceae bacterium]